MPKRKKVPTAKNGQPQVHLTAEQLGQKMEVQRKQAIVKNKLYPALVSATISIDEAKMLVRAIAGFIMEDVMSMMKDRQFSDIAPKLLEKLAVEKEREAALKELLDIFERENLFVSKELIEGMSHAIDQMITDEMRGRKLDTLSVNWDRILAN